MIKIGHRSEYIKLVKESYGDDVDKLTRGLANYMRCTEQLTNRSNEYKRKDAEKCKIET